MDHNWGYATTMLASVRHAELVAQAEHYRRVQALRPAPRPRRHHPWRGARTAVRHLLTPVRLRALAGR